jgi:hypothetical protein
MPRPMRTIPIANQPNTPAEMIASSVMRESERLELGFESESAGFITRGKIHSCYKRQSFKPSKVHAFCGSEHNREEAVQ